VPGERLASLDLGSHTARMLIVERVAGADGFRGLARERAYIRLADGTGPEEVIRPAAVDQTMRALRNFSRIARQYGVERIYGVATGILRRASNRDFLLDRICRETGIRVRVITGEEEALLTSSGVLHSLARGERRPCGIFDLGGATTEFIMGQGETSLILSLPLGAMTLTREFLSSDPPLDRELDALTVHVDRILAGNISEGDPRPALLVGTGGTMTTLGVMIHRISPQDVTPEKMNGLILRRQDIEGLFLQIKGMPSDERAHAQGLDQGRADVIVAGTLVVLRIMHTLGYNRVTVSMSDILEGILIAALGPS
jgi:exopolyphosphatase/guanosine-5'-triphosphate,3'-diphosphate pyrophosphatase